MNPPSPPPITDAKLRRRTWIVEAYWFFQRSVNRVVEEYSRVFPDDAALSKSVVQSNVSKFHENGTVLNLNKGHSGRPSTSTSADNVERVEEFYSDNPRSSLRRASQALDIPVTSLRRIMKTKLKLYPYKIQVFQEITDYDMQMRLKFADTMISRILSRSIRTNKIWFSDEAHFWLSGYVNKQNYRFWAKENPRIFETTCMEPQRISVWCAICEEGIFGPVFIDQTVNGERYLRLLRERFIPYAQGMNAVDRYWFMQDGANPHRTIDVLDFLDEHFTGRVLGLDYPMRHDGGIDWPPYSPDLNPCDFFLRGYLEDKVKAAIQREIHAIDKQTLRNVVNGFESRLHAVMETRGAHIEPYLH